MAFPISMDPISNMILILQGSKTDGERFLKQNLYQEALACYNVALDTAMSLRIHEDEVAKIFSNRSLVFAKLGLPLDALSDAEQCIGLSPKWWKGYWRAAQAHKLVGSLLDCAACLAALWQIQGQTLTEDDQVHVLAEMAVTIIQLSKSNSPGSEHVYEHVELPTNCILWTRVLKQVAAVNNWEAVCLLILGWPGCPDNPFESIAADCPTKDIVVRDLLSSISEVDLKKWGINLAVCLLKKGADVATVARTTNEPIPISALITALQTGVHDLFKYVMENMPAVRAQIDSKDMYGMTALHIMVKSGKTDSFSGEALLKLLLNYGCATDIRDRNGKLPIDYVDKKSPVYGIIMKASQNTEVNLQKKVVYLREAGNTAQREKNYSEALRHYEEAITLVSRAPAMNTELAVLHSNCSLVLSNMGDTSRALTAAHNALIANPKYFKGYWRLGQVYKSTGHFSESYDVFVSGLIKAQHPDEESRTSFLLEIAKLLPPLENTGSPLLRKLTDISAHYSACWQKVLESLSQSGNWSSVRILVLGVKYKPTTSSGVGVIGKDIGFKPRPQGIAASFPACSAVLSSLVDCVEARAWADELTMVLLSQDASPETLSVSSAVPCLHVVVRMCISAENVALLSQVLTDRRLASQTRVQDDKGNTLFHMICDGSGRGNSAVTFKLAQVLLEYHFDAALPNNRGVRPLDLIPHASRLGQLLDSKQHVKPPEPKLHTDAKSWKEEGNKEFKKQNFGAAISHYTQAIEHFKGLTASKENNHDLSVLYGNRAECYLKLGRPDVAIDDAKSSVGFDSEWHKAHTRVGRSFLALDKTQKAMTAFVNAYKCLPGNADDLVHKEILSEVVALYHQLNPSAKPGSPIPGLSQVKGPIWMKTAYYIICHSSVWESAFLAFCQFKHKQLKMSVDLKPFCQRNEMAMNPWTLDFIVMLLHGGSDHKTLSFDTGDTYLQAGVMTYFLTGVESVFNWLLNNRAVPYNELNIQDTAGNTVLHFIVMSRSFLEHKDITLTQLLSCGSNPFVVNRFNMTPLHYVLPGEQKLKKMLKAAESNFAQFQSTKGQQKPQNKTGPSEPNFDRQKSASIPCSDCQTLVKDAREHFSHGEYQIGIKKLGEVIRTNHKGEKHQHLANQSADLIVDELGKMLTPDIPDEMTKLTVAQYKSILEKFAKKDKWRQIVAAVQKYDARHGPDKLSRFAVNISLYKLVESSSLRGSESLRLQVLDLIYEHGAVLPADEGIMKSAISRMELKVVEWLIDHGVSPALFRISAGDTPMHAALSVALERDKGNFLLFEKFLKLFSDDPDKYKFLNPARQDRDGNSLLHIASRCKFNKHSLKAVEILCAQQVPADVTNNEGKMPIQYLTDRNDRRAQFLRITAPTSSRPKAKSSNGGQVKDKPTVNGTDSSHVQKNQNRKTETNVSDSSIADLGIRVSAVIVDSVQGCKERIRELITEMPDSSFSIFKSDGAKQRGPKATEAERIPPASAAAVEVRSRSEEDEGEGVDESEKDTDSLNSAETDDAENELVEEEDSSTELTIDPAVFDNLEWEVECTADVWKTLKDKHVQPETKERVIRRIQLLASGEWRPELCKPIPNAPPTLKLFEAKLSKAARIIWELAIAFSPRLSEAAEKRLGFDTNPDDTFAVKGGRIYSEIIRVWDIVLPHQHLYRAIHRIIKSHDRGETCILHRKLKGIKDDQFRGSAPQKRVPMLYSEEDDDVDLVAFREHQQSLKLYPPASPQETEYHILKFYSFSSTLVSNVLHSHDIKVDFPFRVTDTEQAIINLESKSPILLLGRSGTGKTTCCLYRLWTIFTVYWTKVKEAGGPLLPREHQFIEEEEEDVFNGQEDGEDVNVNTPEVDVTASSSTDSGVSSGLPSDGVDHRDGGDEEPGGDEYEGPEYDHLHQLFVTKNSVLCSEVHKNFSELCHASDIAEEHVGMENDVMPNRLQDVNDFQYPLFLTSRQLLLMLDGSLNAPYFFDRNDDGSLKVVIQGWGTQEDLFGFTPLHHDSDDEQLDSDDEQEYLQDELVAEQAAAAKKRKMDPRREVTYDVFANEVWPKIRKKMSVDYHPTLVWTEIMSFIQGSFEALTKPSGILKKEEYFELGRKRASNFSGERDKIYTLFQRYDHYKTQKFLFDESDLIYSIYRRLRNLDDQPWVLHQMYVDETQDFTQAELAVLIRIIQNPNNMFLTGDTAQSIMRGISFRFSDLKTLFYYAKKSLHALGKTRSIEVPKQVYQLTHNYRSHAGILSLASAILDLMVEFFPDSFDRLQKDQGLFEGPPPVLLESCSPGDLAILLQGHKRKTSHIEFGAHQAILVVNEAARDSIPDELRLGLILTIYEAKGLEFDDVLLYNFFKDSYASKEWRVVTDFLERLRKHDDNTDKHENLVRLDEDVLRQPSRPRPLTFNPNQHKVLNSELKHLYTALTRARVNVWIFDESEEKRAPMFEFFKAQRLVRVVSNSDEEIDLDSTIFAEKSSAADWEKRGDEIIKRYLYEVAAKCYRMAGCENKEKIANAHNQALRASRIKDNPRKMRDEYLSAARTFLECGLSNKGALCLQNAHEYQLAAHVHEKNGQFLQAARTYLRSKMPLDCSRCYEQHGYFNKAIDVLYREELFDQAIDCLRRYTIIIEERKSKEQNIPQVLLDNQPQDAYTVDRLTYKSAEMHARYKNKTKMVAALERLSRVEEKINFLKNHQYYDEAAEYLIKGGKTTEAVQLRLKNGRLEEALAAAEKGRDMALIGECHFIVSHHLLTKPDGMEVVIHHLNKAVESFQAAGDNSGLGKALVVLARIKIDKAMAKQAYKLFQEERPYSNEAGMMDALQIVVELSSQELEFEDCFAIIRGIEMTFRVIEKLFKQNTAEDKARAQLYYRFFGLYQNSAKPTHFEIHPKERPRCIEVIEDFFLDRKDKKEAVVEREKDLICISLSCFMIGRMKEWLYIVESAFRNKFQHNMQCKTYLQGIECEDLCPFMHRAYSQTETFEALKLFVWDVSLSYIIQTGTDMIKRMDIAELSAEVKNLVEEETKYDSCERLLGFLMPLHHHPRLLSENATVVTQVVALLVSNGNMRNQVKKYLEHLWINPATKEKKDLNKERCRSTDWVLRTDFFASLLKLDLDVTRYCQDLQKQLITDAPKWLAKRSLTGKLPYALFVEYYKNTLIVECIANRYLDAMKWLKVNADPMESIIKFTKFVSVLSLRDRPALLPAKSTMLFWLEVFVSLSLFLLAKISSPGTANITGGGIHFILPATYLAAIHFVDSSFKKGSLLIQEIVHRYRPHPRQNINKLLLDRLQKIVGLVSGFRSRMSLLRLLFTVTRDDYLAAERCLILTLVVLVNVGQLLPALYEDPIMKSIITLQLPDSAPQRLKMTLQAVSRATGLSDIAAILQDLLHERGDEHLLDCVWSWDSGRRQGVQYRVLTDLSTFSKGFKSAGTMDTGNFADSKLEVEDDLSDEEEMSPEDRERFQKELVESEIEKKKNTAARVIQRFFKHITFRYHMTGLKMRALMQEMLEVFAPFAVTEKFCGVCGLNLLPPETDQSVTGLSYHAEREYWDTSESPSSSVADDRTASRSVETLQRHRTSPEHNEKNIQFETFKRLYYRDNMRQLLHELSLFIGIHKLRCPDMKTTAYADVSLDIDRLLSEMDNVKTILQNIMGNRSWEKIEELRRALFILYQDYLGGRVVIIRKFHEHKDSDKERDKESPVRDEPREPTPEVDDPDEYVIPPEDFIPAPAPRNDRGRNSGRGRGRGYGGGYRRGRGQAHGYQGPDNLPPRLRRQLNMN